MRLRVSAALAALLMHGAQAHDTAAALLRARFPANYDGSKLHIVFSNGCGQKKRLLFATMLQHSATRVGQKGPITQILSGCTEDEKVAVLKEPRFYYDYRVHFTPNYFPHPVPDVDDYYYAYNKPFALRHYLQNAQPPVQHELMALTDGDIMLFRPLEANTGRNMTKYYFEGTRDPLTITDTVKDGVALAQDWTHIIGSGFFGDKWGANMTAQMCTGKPCAGISESEGQEYYAAAGPPYIMTRSDMLRFIVDYCHFVVESRKVSKQWMAEMFGYGVAAANHGIRHTLLTNLAPTHPFQNGHEYWSFLNDESLKENPCADPFEIAVPADPPVGVHFFHNYMLGAAGRQFHKGAIPSDILECDQMLLEVPKAGEYDAVFTNYKDNPVYMAQKRVEVWTECTLIKAANQALVALKSALCRDSGYNAFPGVVMMHKTKT
ncbi:hypothetical protein Gpo141_00012059 [Globisporangium polare]